MTDKYQPGDVLENLLEINKYTFVVERPSPQNEGCYLVLDLILQSVNEKAGEGTTFGIPPGALRTSLEIDSSRALYRKIDHINLKQNSSELIRLVGDRITMEIPELEKYLRVDRDY